jgi:hypothetical protein
MDVPKEMPNEMPEGGGLGDTPPPSPQNESSARGGGGSSEKVSPPSVDFTADTSEKVEAPEVDLTSDLVGDRSPAAKGFDLVPYDPRPHEDSARRRIAYALIAILAAVVFWMLLLLHCEVIAVGDLKEFAVILGPLVTLVSAATGFYYGTKSGGPSNDG